MDASILLLQVAVILAAARALGLALRRIGQPGVVGEIAAGLVLGPLVFGALAPATHQALFPPASLAALDGLAQIGLVLFMFTVGLEVRPHAGQSRGLMPAVTVALLSLLVPFALGVGLGQLIHADLAPADVTPWPFSLFIGCALAITAFPVMARILKERRLAQSAPGRLALTSAAIADVLAWGLLTLVVAVAGGGGNPLRVATMLAGLLVLGALLFGVARPAMTRLLARRARAGRHGVSMTLLAALLIGLFLCAFATAWLGAHPVFGAFLFGASVPRDDELTATLTDRVEHVATLVLLPVFFALAGLNTSPDAFSGTRLDVLVVILAAAVAGKLLGGTLGARLGGQGWRESLAVGALMNTRGLMELIVIKVGYDLGLIGPELFTMLLFMALLTTAMTGPLLTATLGHAPAPAPGSGQAGDTAR